MDEYFKLLCWVFCIWDILILIALLYLLLKAKKVVDTIQKINIRHRDEVEIQEEINYKLQNIVEMMENS